MKRIRTLLVCALVAASLSAPALAILGIGDIVFDPANLEQAILQLAQMKQQYEQLLQQYQVMRQQYDHMRFMAQGVPVDMNARYKALATPWRMPSTTNVYGTTSDWMAAVTSGMDVLSRYAKAVERLREYGPALGKLSTEEVERIKRSYATVELTDGVNQHTIETVGRLRANAASIDRTIDQLELDSLSQDAAMNTEIAVLNKINAAELITLRSTQDANKLLVTLAESQLLNAKRCRDAETRAINTHIRFLQEAPAAMAAQAAGASEAMLAWRMP